MDRTLIRKDSASLFVRYQRDIGEAGLRDGVRVGWWMLQYTLGVINAQRVAQKALQSFRGRNEDAFAESCRGWYRDYVREHICERARTAVREHGERGDTLMIVTGATRYAAEPLAEELGIEHVVCTRLEVDAEGCFTGRVQPPMCYADGKIRLAEERGQALGVMLDDAVFYSDSITDLPLLEHVAEPVAVNPDRRLRRIARRRGWRIEHW